MTAEIASTIGELKARGSRLKSRRGRLNWFVAEAPAGEFRGINSLIMLQYFYLFVLVLLLLLTSGVRAQDTVRPGKGGLVTRNLKPGVRQYLVTYLDPGKDRQLRFWYVSQPLIIRSISRSGVSMVTAESNRSQN